MNKWYCGPTIDVLYDALIPQLSRLLNSFEQPLSMQSFSSLVASEGCILASSGERVSQSLLSQVRYLFVRSTTQINQALLNIMPALEFVATATSGTDHLCFDALKSAGIEWYDAKGSNAHAVADYVIYALAALQAQSIALKSGRAVVVGYGCVGQEVVSHLSTLGCKPAFVDPFFESCQQELGSGLCIQRSIPALSLSATVESWLSTTTLLCVHTPLRTQEPWPTQGWLNVARLAALPDGAVVVCAGRGEVLHQEALIAHAHRLNIVLDVWPNEPVISPQLLHAVCFATPHIAGHSKLGKLKGAWQVFEHFSHWKKLNLNVTEKDFYKESLDGKTGNIAVPLSASTALTTQLDSIQALNNVLEHHVILQEACSVLKTLDRQMRLDIDLLTNEDEISQKFIQLRKSYSQHYEIKWV